MMEPYLKLGLEWTKFYATGGYTSKAWISNEFYYRQPPFSKCDWLFLWLADWQTWRQMECEKYKFWDSTEWQKVLDFHPKLEGMTKSIEEWFAQSDYRNPTRFGTKYNELVEKMGMDPEDDDSWFYLSPGDKHPIKHQGLPL